MRLKPLNETSYPYLKIAELTGEPYSLVLDAAECMRNGQPIQNCPRLVIQLIKEYWALEKTRYV